MTNQSFISLLIERSCEMPDVKKPNPVFKPFFTAPEASKVDLLGSVGGPQPKKAKKKKAKKIEVQLTQYKLSWYERCFTSWKAAREDWKEALDVFDAAIEVLESPEYRRQEAIKRVEEKIQNVLDASVAVDQFKKKLEETTDVNARLALFKKNS